MAKARPHFNDLNAPMGDVIIELIGGTERASVMVAAAYLDEVLGMMLRHFLVANQDDVDDILRFDGPLGSFGARAKMLYCLGLLRPEAYSDLNYIRRIRNKFAHTYEQVSFTEQQVASWCYNLKCFGDDDTQAPRDRFIFAVQHLIYEIRADTMGLTPPAPGSRRAHL